MGRRRGMDWTEAKRKGETYAAGYGYAFIEVFFEDEAWWLRGTRDGVEAVFCLGRG